MVGACKTCGAPLNRVQNYYVCEFCRNKWEIDSDKDVNAVDRANAWSALREGDFEKAEELFENIIVKESNNHEAYWGRALAKGGIVYVTDLNENKKVPTCNNITEESFINGTDVQKAISLAPTDIAVTYSSQAEYIEKVRVEWLEKASKEPEYDVFISYKDSDRENGIERTQDSIDAQDLYNALIAEGYNVFFSRISLREKIAEQYEPYIYNAIKTAKVMAVFGEKPEYFNSVWIKNEWSRFKSRIEKGEKHKNSLVVVYKNMNPSELPVVLKTRQCLNAGDMTFFSDLSRHIKRVIGESKKAVTLEKIKIEGGQIAKKVSALSINSITMCEIGAGAIATIDISEKQTLSLIKTYIEAKQWNEADKLIEDILFNNPGCAEAMWVKILVTYKATSNLEIIDKLDVFKPDDYALIEKILNCAEKEFAEEILVLLYDSEKKVSELTYKKLLDVILPFSFNNRSDYIRKAFEGVILESKYEVFKLLLCTLDTSEVDDYINYNFDYAVCTSNYIHKTECWKNILQVDEGNVATLREMVVADLEIGKTSNEVIEDFENLLKYSNDVDAEVRNCMEWLCDNLENVEDYKFAKQLIRYYTKNISYLKKKIIKLSYRIIEQKLFEDATYFLELLLSIDEKNSDAYWGICLVKAKAQSDEDLKYSELQISDIPEFNKYMTMVDEKRQQECIRILNAQKLTRYRKKCELAYSLFALGYGTNKYKGALLNVHTKKLHRYSFDRYRGPYELSHLEEVCSNEPYPKPFDFSHNKKNIVMQVSHYDLKNDGFVYYRGELVINLYNVVQILAIRTSSVSEAYIAILQDGRCVLYDYFGPTDKITMRKNTSYWRNYPEEQQNGYERTREILKWTNMVAIKDNGHIAIGLRKDGTVVYTYGDHTQELDMKCFDNFDTIIEDYNNEVQEQVEAPVNTAKKGCYVATCVYGSYDCPQVWILRRFRDQVLSSSWYGRVFIRFYYSISPVLVEKFGSAKWFRRMWKKPLDKMVSHLKKKGFKDIPYKDL